MISMLVVVWRDGGTVVNDPPRASALWQQLIGQMFAHCHVARQVAPRCDHGLIRHRFRRDATLAEASEDLVTFSLWISGVTMTFPGPGEFVVDSAFNHSCGHESFL